MFKVGWDSFFCILQLPEHRSIAHLIADDHSCLVMFCFVFFLCVCFVLFCFVLFCFVSCYVMCYVIMLCYVMLCYVMLCYVMLCYVMLCYVMFCFVLFCSVLFYFALLCYAMPCFVVVCFCLVFLFGFIFSEYVLFTCLFSLPTVAEGSLHCCWTSAQKMQRLCWFWLWLNIRSSFTPYVQLFLPALPRPWCRWVEDYSFSLMPFLFLF